MRGLAIRLRTAVRGDDDGVRGVRGDVRAVRGARRGLPSSCRGEGKRHEVTNREAPFRKASIE
jgi:hypothetical protein